MDGCQLNVNPSFDLVLSELGRELADSQVNRENSVLALPGAEARSSLRPRLSLEICDGVRLLAAPHLTLSLAKVRRNGDWERERVEQRIQWAELLGTISLGESLTVAYGIQNYQWGDAESGSPTNPFFATGVPGRLLFHHTLGQELFRATLASGRAASVTLLSEAQGISAEGRRSLVRAEAGWEVLGLQVSGVWGFSEKSRPWWGESVKMEPVEGWSLYAEAAHRACVPIPRAKVGSWGTVTLAVERCAGPGSFLAQGTVGSRYLFEGGSEARAEILFNEAGLGRQGMNDFAAAAASVAPVAKLWGTVAALPLTKSHAYASLRVPDLGPRKKFTLLGWSLHSLSDGSGVASLVTDWQASDSATAALAIKKTYGPRDSDATRGDAWVVELGQKISW